MDVVWLTASTVQWVHVAGVGQVLSQAHPPLLQIWLLLVSKKQNGTGQNAKLSFKMSVNKQVGFTVLDATWIYCIFTASEDKDGRWTVKNKNRQ